MTRAKRRVSIRITVIIARPAGRGFGVLGGTRRCRQRAARRGGGRAGGAPLARINLILTVRVSDLCGVLEPGHHRHGAHHERPVDGGDVDLALVRGRGVAHREPRERAQRHALAHDGEAAGDESLRGDDRRAGGHHHGEPVDGGRGRDGRPEGARRLGGGVDQEGCLAQVREREAGIHHHGEAQLRAWGRGGGGGAQRAAPAAAAAAAAGAGAGAGKDGQRRAAVPGSPVC